MDALERNGLTPADSGFYPAARTAVIELGIVRRRKVDVAADIPARRIADMPVELEGGLGQSIRDAERALARRLVQALRERPRRPRRGRRSRRDRPRARPPGRDLGAARREGSELARATSSA